MKRFYKISESFVQELLQSAALKCQKWPLSSCFPHLTQISTQHCAPKYNVFLNFRGRDTRQTFVHYLYEALRSKGIIAFRDDKSVNKGEPIRRELFHAIEECRIAIVILSENYAASEWCLEELVKIMKCKKRLTIFPVFYDVCPSEVRNLRGSFCRAFAEHEKNYENKPSKVKTWKKALSEAAGISGFDLSTFNGDEKKCIEDITEEVCKKLEAIKREKQKPKLRQGMATKAKSDLTGAAAGWASPPYYPHQSLQTIEPYIRETKASAYSLDVG
ncbi:TMV resistance protein N-like [Ipomoea triloba]|uniref:TMV resistance protein N-like n=1 Tax=Ipomoea triloba TaxID=35885 RepID=UPI00125DDB34|nr:TMV resistance protein N-like [Ipomoea triloba]